MTEPGIASPALFTPNPCAPGELYASVAGELQIRCFEEISSSGILSLPASASSFVVMKQALDIVTGRHLKKVPQAVEEIYDCLETKPSVVMICLTCVDALLGTDMERICKRAQKAVGIPVLPCYMYALTREGRIV